MTYTDYTLEEIEARFEIINRREKLFAEIIPIPISEFLRESLLNAQELPLKSEKSKSEWIVVPVLTELRRLNNKYFTIYSGDYLNVDEANGLKGECDFIIAKDTGSFSVSFPIIQIVEAKKNDLEIGIPQCAAQLIGARVFNEKKGVKLDKVYGCVTTGNEWIFLCLSHELKIDSRIYYLNEVELVLGIFQNIIDQFKALN
jgi:hypothetical protein